MAVNDVLALTVIGSLHGQTVINTMHYVQVEGVITVGEPLLVAAWIAHCMPDWKAVHSVEYSIEGVMAQRILPVPPSVPFLTTTANGPGTVAGDSLPSSVAVTLTKRTVFAGPRYRGRLFMAGIPVDWNFNSVVSPAGSIVYQALCDKLDDNLDDADTMLWSPVLWHRETQAYNNITRFDARNTLRNQRRRQVGVGF